MRSVATSTLISAFAGLFLLLLATCSRAQVIDSIDWRRDGSDAVLQVSFGVPIQFLRSVMARSKDQAQAFYELRPVGDLPQLVLVERHVAGSPGLPSVSVSDEAVLGVLSRRLVVRFDRPVDMRVRAGRGNCCIEVVVVGAGPAADARNPTPPPPAEDRFLVTLQQSNDPNLRMEVPVPGELQAYQLFTARRVVDGRTVYEINLGYFSTRAEADRAQKVLKLRFPQATVVELTPQAPPAEAVAALREPQAAPPPAAATAPAVPPAAAPATPAAPEGGAAVPTVPTPPPVPIFPVPSPSPPAPAPAPAPTPAPPAETPKAEAPQVVPPPATPAAPAAEAPPAIVTPPAPAPAAPGEIDLQGRVLLAQGRAAMDKGDFEQAIGLLNQLLNLPPNIGSQDGQELIGVARARLGDVQRARAEFDLYLKLYPTGAGADRVRAELAKLGVDVAQARRVRVVPPTSTFFGSFSQYYFGGRSLFSSLTEGTPLPTSVLPNSATISHDDQRLLQSSLDLAYRYRDTNNDLRVVFRDTYNKSFLNETTFSTRAPNRLTAAYVDYKALPTGVSARLGRQSPTGDGVLTRFDGARLGYTFVPNLSLNAVVGVPTDDFFGTKRRFYGTSLDFDNVGGHLSGDIYGIQQTIDGQTDRRAVGTELRYFTPGLSTFGQYDFDTLFHAANIASLQGTWQPVADKLTVTFLADRRAAPILATGNALLQPDTIIVNGQSTIVPHNTLTDFLQTHSIDYARQLAKATTAYVKQGQLGTSLQVTQNVQFGLNAQLTNVGALPGFDPEPGRVQAIAPTPPTGNVLSYTSQAIVSNLYSERDTHVLSFTYLTAPTVTYADPSNPGGPPKTSPGYKGIQVAYNNSSALTKTLQFDPSIRYYQQNNTDSTSLTRWSPGLRLSWRAAPKVTIEGAVNYEISHMRHPIDPVNDPTPVVDTTKVFFYFVGYRVDF